MLFKSFFFILYFSSYYCNDELPLVNTPLGKIRGYFRTSHDGKIFSAFEGIPYAKPPIGKNRFEEPDPIEPWLGIWNATLPSVCPQTDMKDADLITGDEDCLHINVYVPRTKSHAKESLEVIVHIHGGAYTYRSGTAYARPELLMDREIIFVTFNYRLGILGFLSTEDDVVPGNNGLKDQVLALKWIQDNIAGFGGNPRSVTITGLSAGGSSVHLHYFSDLSRGLFHRGYSQSGVALNSWSIQKKPLDKAKRLAYYVGCPTSSTRILVDCLKQRSYREILKQIWLFFGYRFVPAVPFGPVVEKEGSKPFLKDDPYNLLVQGQVYDVPWIASTTTHEGLFPVIYFLDDLDYIDENWNNLAPILLDFNYTLPQSEWEITSEKIKKFYLGKEKLSKENFMKFVQMVGDRFFLADIETAVRLQSKVTKSPVYYYVFGYPGDNNEEIAVGHGADRKYYFGTMLYKPIILTPNELKMKDLLVDMLISFAKTGKPTFGKVEWKPTAYDELTYLSIFGVEPEEIHIKTTKELTSRSFWKSLNFNEGENLISVKDEL